jgi:hypothetical protein
LELAWAAHWARLPKLFTQPPKDGVTMTLSTKLGAGATLLALGGLAAVAAGQAGDDHGKRAASAPVVVRTEVIRQTVRVVRHEKPKRRPHASVAALAQRRASAAPPPAAAPTATAPLRPRVAAVAPAPHRVTTRTSGGHGGESDDKGEHDD